MGTNNIWFVAHLVMLILTYFTVRPKQEIGEDDEVKTSSFDFFTMRNSEVKTFSVKLLH